MTHNFSTHNFSTHNTQWTFFIFFLRCEDNFYLCFFYICVGQLATLNFFKLKFCIRLWIAILRFLLNNVFLKLHLSIISIASKYFKMNLFNIRKPPWLNSKCTRMCEYEYVGSKFTTHLFLLFPNMLMSYSAKLDFLIIQLLLPVIN